MINFSPIKINTNLTSNQVSFKGKEKDKNTKEGVRKATRDYQSFIDPKYYIMLHRKEAPSINFYRLLSLKPLLIHFSTDNCIRGIDALKENCDDNIHTLKSANIDTIVDLNPSKCDKEAREIMEDNGVDYVHFPLDEENINSKKIIKDLPKLFEAIDDGNVYLNSENGVKATDVALAINYFFNPDYCENNPPILSAFMQCDRDSIENVMKSVNAIYENLSDEDKQILRLKSLTESNFEQKRLDLIDTNANFGLRSLLY